jgi:hypothetical protein
LPTPPVPAPGTNPLPTKAQLRKWMLFTAARAFWSAESLTPLLMMFTLWKGEQLAQSSGVPVALVFAIGFLPALCYTIDLLRAKRQRQAKRSAV